MFALDLPGYMYMILCAQELWYLAFACTDTVNFIPSQFGSPATRARTVGRCNGTVTGTVPAPGKYR